MTGYTFEIGFSALSGIGLNNRPDGRSFDHLFLQVALFPAIYTFFFLTGKRYRIIEKERGL